MADLYPLIVTVHVVGGVGFILTHAVSMVVAFQLRGVTDRGRAATLLGRSLKAVMAMYVALLVLLVSGIVGGFVGDHWGRLWIWVSIAILVAVIAVMYSVASPYYGGLRRALGTADGGKEPAPEPLNHAELAARLASTRPMWLALVGLSGLAAIIALMYLKPF